MLCTTRKVLQAVGTKCSNTPAHTCPSPPPTPKVAKPQTLNCRSQFLALKRSPEKKHEKNLPLQVYSIPQNLQEECTDPKSQAQNPMPTTRTLHCETYRPIVEPCREPLQTGPKALHRHLKQLLHSAGPRSLLLHEGEKLCLRCASCLGVRLGVWGWFCFRRF